MRGKHKHFCIVSTCILVCTSACDMQSQAEGRIPLDKLVGELITFEMCGQQFQIPKRRISQLYVDSAPGYSRLPKESVFLPVIELQNHSNPMTHRETTSGEINCSMESHKTTYRNPPPNYSQRVIHAEYGLEQLIYNDETYNETTYFRPLDSTSNGKGFVFSCLTLPPERKPSRCEISGWVSDHIHFNMLIEYNSSLKNWQGYKIFFENFIILKQSEQKASINGRLTTQSRGPPWKH
jgi:hypothetical protein